MLCRIHAIQAEIQLQDGITAFSEVQDFVSKHHRWPRSWEELEAEPPPDSASCGDWRLNWARIRQHVQIDFEIDPKKIGSQDLKRFNAVKPVARNYDYNHWIMSLQFEVRKSIPYDGER